MLTLADAAVYTLSLTPQGLFIRAIVLRAGG